MKARDREFLGTAKGCTLMRQFLAEQTPELKRFYQERARGSEFAPCPRHKGWWLRKRDYCDFCPHARRDP